MRFEVTILGNSSATPAYDRNPTAQVVNVNERLYLIDCGEGTQHRLLKYGIKYQRIDYIFISHLHGDHYFGLIGLLSTMNLNGRVRPLKIFAPSELKNIIAMQVACGGRDFNYPIEYVDLYTDESRLIFDDDDVEVRTIMLEHRVPCTGFLFTEKSRKRRIDIEKVEQLKVPVNFYPLLKLGINYQDKQGNVHLAEDLTLDPEPSRSYAYCSDTRYTEAYFDTIRGVDLLYHEATFLNDMEKRAQETMHTTAAQAARVAQQVGAKKLLLGHFSARYRTLDAIKQEAEAIFSSVALAEEGETFKV